MNRRAAMVLFLLWCLPPHLGAKSAWRGDNEARLQKMMRESAGSGPSAIFDWDNTVIKNDIGDATFFWMILHDQIHRPSSWKKTSRYLTPAAVMALNRDCPLSSPDPLPTSVHPACEDTLLGIYHDGLVVGKPAWLKRYDPDRMEPAYAWAVQLMAGHSPQEVREITLQVIWFSLKQKVGAQQKIGNKSYPSSIRIYEPMRRLIRDLQKNQFDVWVVSASSQYLVESFAKRVGIQPDRVIGVRSKLDDQGRLTGAFEPCGGEETIPYRKGKVCWIDKIIRRPITFAAGDSDSDLFFLQKATRLRLVINRNKRELMCHAYSNQDGNGLINPMFIEPKPKKSEVYHCQEFGLPDQEDSVY